MSVCMDNLNLEFSQLRQSCRTGDLESISDLSTPISELVKIQTNFESALFSILHIN